MKCTIVKFSDIKRLGSWLPKDHIVQDALDAVNEALPKSVAACAAAENRVQRLLECKDKLEKMIAAGESPEKNQLRRIREYAGKHY